MKSDSNREKSRHSTTIIGTTHHLAHRPGYEEHRREGRDRGQHAEDHRHRDSLGAANRAQQRVAAALLLGVGVLADDDRVVDDDARAPR